jgi:hypothetical protein
MKDTLIDILLTIVGVFMILCSIGFWIPVLVFAIFDKEWREIALGFFFLWLPITWKHHNWRIY